MPWYLGNSRAMDQWLGGGIVIVALWSSLWTGLVLWHAARREQKGWFIFFLLVHTAGILEILYLLFVTNVLASDKKSSKKRSRS